jgi:hypothetical protein
MSAAFIENRLHRVCRMLGYALALGDDAEAWEGLATVLRGRLTLGERGRLLASVLGSLHVDDALPVIEVCVETHRAGAPIPVLDDIEAEARWWSDLASPPELRAWLTACFVRLPASEQAAFLESATRRDAGELKHGT